MLKLQENFETPFSAGDREYTPVATFKDDEGVTYNLCAIAEGKLFHLLGRQDEGEWTLCTAWPAEILVVAADKLVPTTTPATDRTQLKPGGQMRVYTDLTPQELQQAMNLAMEQGLFALMSAAASLRENALIEVAGFTHIVASDDTDAFLPLAQIIVSGPLATELHAMFQESGRFSQIQRIQLRIPAAELPKVKEKSSIIVP